MIRFRLALFAIAFALAAASSFASYGAVVPAIPEILLSRQVMEQTGIHVGDVVTLAIDAEGSGAEKFRVVGMYEPTPNPLKFSVRQLEARLHLPDLIRLTADPNDPASSESISAINLTVNDPKHSDAVISSISGRALGLDVRQTATEGDSGETFRVIDRFHWAIAIVTVFGSTAFLLALMIIRAEERKDIVGILRLMGIPPRSIFVEVLIEGLLIASAGAVLGTIVALIGQVGVNRYFQWRYDTSLVFVQVTLPIIWQSIAFAVPLGVIAGVLASSTLLGRHVISLIRR